MIAKALHPVVSLLLLVSAGILTAAPPDEFYLQRLRAGSEFYRQGNSVVAADEFRIACFGFLERPVLLVEGLARLTLAQAKTGRSAEADEALGRFVVVEQRFRVFQDAALEPALRAEFVEFAKRRLPAETFRGIPSLSGLALKKEETSKSEAIPTKVESRAPAVGVVAVPKIEKPDSPDRRQDVEAIRKLIDDRKLAEAWTLAQEALGKGTPSRDLQKAALAAAVLSGNYGRGLPVAVSLDPFNNGEETDAFYAGVAFWETGNRKKATEIFRLVAPRVAQSTWVKYYLDQAFGK